MLLRQRITTWLPEILLVLLALFFAFRELSTFPAVWADDGLFMIVAKSVSMGQGYALPVLGKIWPFPYILSIGPPLILPAALSLKIFGFSVEAARFPMALYLLGTCALLYIFTQRSAGRTAARWALLLLITLSAFVNTGKPVMGEIPGFFFLLLGLLVLHRNKIEMKHAILAGFCFGLAILAKLTYGIVLPVLLLPWAIALLRRDWATVRWLTVTGLLAFAMYLPWRFLEMSSATGLGGEFRFLIGEGADEGDVLFLTRIFRGELVFLRPPFVLYGLLLVLGSTGLWKLRTKLPKHLVIILFSLITLFTLFFVGSFGWYRHLLPAHMLLLPFVFVGATAFLGKKIAAAVLLGIALLQGLWQLDHRGSSGSMEAIATAQYVEEHYRGKDLLVRAQEVYVRLSPDPHWLFYTGKKISLRIPKEFTTLTAEQQCMPVLMKLSSEEIMQNKDTAEQAGGRYYILPPAEDC